MTEINVYYMDICVGINMLQGNMQSWFGQYMISRKDSWNMFPSHHSFLLSPIEPFLCCLWLYIIANEWLLHEVSFCTRDIHHCLHQSRPHIYTDCFSQPFMPPLKFMTAQAYRHILKIIYRHTFFPDRNNIRMLN